MPRPRMSRPDSSPYVLALGVGAFSHGVLAALRADGARVATYLTRDYAHHGPGLVGPVFDEREHPNPCPLLRRDRPDLIVPMSIEWSERPWAEEFLALGLPFLCPTGAALELERRRDFARALCARFGIAFPVAAVAADADCAAELVRRHQRAFVLKNPVCGPNSPIHTIVCETMADTLGWLPRLNYGDGVFLQEYLGRAEAGHIALVSAGEIHSLVTNQEYKRAFDGDMGVVAGAPLGGIVERDEQDRHGLARELLHPLLPWFREVGFHGPVQVTAIRHAGRWYVLEYNVRLGVTSGPLIARLLANPLATLRACARNEPLAPRWRDDCRLGCSVTLAGYGYPYTSLSGPRVPVTRRADDSAAAQDDAIPPADVWWNEVALAPTGGLEATGHRLCDVAAVAPTLDLALAAAYREIARLHCLGSYYRRDVGRSLWPPGAGAAGPVVVVPAAPRPARLEIDLGRLARNLAAIRAHAAPSGSRPPELLCVVKDAAYGHGAVEVSRTVLGHGATRLAVASVAEGCELRRAGIAAPILVLGSRDPAELPECLLHNLILAVGDTEVPAMLSRLAGAGGRRAKIHLEINTGMNRYGVAPVDATRCARELTQLPALELEGVFSHFAMSDAADPTFSLQQLEVFRAVLAGLAAAGIRPPLRHLCNSGGFLNFPAAHFDLVRLGLLPLGLHPSPHTPRVAGLAPVMSLKARVALVRPVAAGESVGYGRKYFAPSPRRIAVLPLGYGDGYPRLANTGQVLVRGHRAPIRGGVTMDALMVDVTDIPGAAAGDEAVVLGAQGGEIITAHDLAGWAGTVSYDVLVGWSQRLPRRYLR